MLASTSTLRRPTQSSSDDRAEDVAEAVRADKDRYSKRRLGEGDISLDDGKLAEAISEERKRKARDEDGDDESRGNKRKYNSASGGYREVTEEELGTHLICRVDRDFPLTHRLQRHIVGTVTSAQKIQWRIMWMPGTKVSL